MSSCDDVSAAAKPPAGSDRSGLWVWQDGGDSRKPRTVLERRMWAVSRLKRRKRTIPKNMGTTDWLVGARQAAEDLPARPRFRTEAAASLLSVGDLSR
jgi:hypothetical protein